jgi:hypothetical protein
MKKIISLFQRNYEGDRLVRNEVVPGADWVLAGEGVATRKFDGSCCLVRGGKLFKRYDHRPDNWKSIQRALNAGAKPYGLTAVWSAPPAGFKAAQEEPDPNTFHLPGWLPVGDGLDDRWHREAWASRLEACAPELPPDGTCELVGPKVQGNSEGYDHHALVYHGGAAVYLAHDPPPRDFDGIREYLRTHDIEGIVWHHPDGRMVKIKAKDFGIKRGGK